jgi:hypothetical protein
MFGHHLQFHLVPPGHPGASRGRAPNEHPGAENPFRRAADEAVLLRARLREHESQGGCEGSLLSEAA